MGPQPALVSRYTCVMRKAMSVAVLCAALALSAAAQMRGGVPASVTSSGFGGHPGFHGVPASVTSPGFGAPRFGGHGVVPFGHHPRGFIGPGFRGNRFFPNRFFPGSVAPFFPTPIVVPFFDYYDDGAAAQPPTIITQPSQPQPIVIVVPDRGDREISQRDQAPPDPPAPVAAAKPEPPPPPTIVVLRDGHRLELTDYAITGDTLYDLHGGRAKKIAVSDIDLPATVKVNEERGFEFTLPNAARVHIQ
jgi:hypothetical protein